MRWGRGLDGAAVLTLRGEELGPGHNLGMLFEQGAALTLGHAAPDAELHPIVQRVGTAFGDNGAVPADHGGLALGGAANEQFVRVGLPAAGLRDPRDTRFGLCAGCGTTGLRARAYFAYCSREN